MTRLCWTCKYFVADNPATLLSGRCRRHAPAGLDYLTYKFADRAMCHLEFGAMDPAGDVFGDGALVPLYQNANVAGAPSCFPSDGDGWNDPVVNPFMIPFHGRITKVHLAWARLNTGAPIVGTAPILQIQHVEVRGTTQYSNPDVIRIPIPPEHLQPRDTLTDNYHSISISPDLMKDLTVNALSQGPVGFRVDCTAANSNRIYQFRLLKIAFLLTDWNGVDISPPSSLEKWAYIDDGSINKCGEYVPAISVVPPIPAP